MLVDILGYNKFDYTNKDGESKSAVKFYVKESNPSDKITFGIRCFEVFATSKYGQKLLDGYEAGQDIHIGWGQKDNRAFLYLK